MSIQTNHCNLKCIQYQGMESFNDSIEQEKQIEWIGETFNLKWEVILNETNERLGTVGLIQLSNMLTCEITYTTKTNDIDIEIVEEVLDAVINYAFDDIRIPRLVIKVRGFNLELIRLLKGLGMSLDDKVIQGGQVQTYYSISNQQLVNLTKMRPPSMVIHQIIKFAKQHEEIRILMQTGLRLDKHAPIDLMRDFHFRLFIQAEFFVIGKKSEDWEAIFGELVIMKRTIISKYIVLYQMQFMDGVRLDLEFISTANLWGTIYEETLCRVLLDKDGILPAFDEPNDSAHHLQMPTEEEFKVLMNDLWWYQIEVAKAIYRDELPLAKWVYDAVLMERILKLLSWKVGIRYHWQIDLGRHMRWIKRYLPESVYSDFIHLYPTKGYLSIWERLFCMGPFIHKIATEVSEVLNFSYDKTQGDSVTYFLHRINSLPDNATDFNI